MPTWRTAKTERQSKYRFLFSLAKRRSKGDAASQNSLRKPTLVVDYVTFAWHFVVATTHHSQNFWRDLENQLLDLVGHFKRSTTADGPERRFSVTSET